VAAVALLTAFGEAGLAEAGQVRAAKPFVEEVGGAVCWVGGCGEELSVQAAVQAVGEDPQDFGWGGGGKFRDAAELAVDPGDRGSWLVRTSSSASTEGALAAPIRWNISCACRRRDSARVA
jgi:hypothetical protein